MSSLAQMHKRSGGGGAQLGIARVYPFLTAAEGAGVQIGLADFGPGVLPVEQSYAEAIYVLEGEIEVACGGCSETLSAGECLWLPSGEIIYTVQSRCRYLYVIPAR